MASKPQMKSEFGHILVNFGHFEKKIDLIPNKFKKYKSPKMVSKLLYGHYLRSCEQF